jgi:8-oxo-dGTP diphosphatase
MVLILNEKGQILVELRNKKDWPGLTLPGGHVEPEETLTASVIRETEEETGLVIKDPVLCDVMEWPWTEGSRYLAFLYRAEDYSGTLKSSAEGKVFWISPEDIHQYPLSQDFEKILSMMLKKK